MVRVWYMDSDTNDHQLEHHRNPPEFLTLEELFHRTGVEYYALNVDTYATDGKLDEIKEKRGYTFEDEGVCSKEHCPNYEEIFYKEHLHTHEEIRLILEGTGYFDVRDRNDEWIRIETVPGDMVIIPSGIYHRFTFDTKNFIRGKRFFVGEPIWTPHNRPADEMDCRKSYLEKLTTGFAAV